MRKAVCVAIKQKETGRKILEDDGGTWLFRQGYPGDDGI